jgi:hypothetical protein
MWNALLFCLTDEKLQLLKYVNQNSTKPNLRLLLSEPLESETDFKGKEGINFEIFALIKLLLTRNFKTFEYLWNDHSYLWDTQHIV